MGLNRPEHLITRPKPSSNELEYARRLLFEDSGNRPWKTSLLGEKSQDYSSSASSYLSDGRVAPSRSLTCPCLPHDVVFVVQLQQAATKDQPPKVPDVRGLIRHFKSSGGTLDGF